MPNQFYDLVYQGAAAMLAAAEKKLNYVIETTGAETLAGYLGTVYKLPLLIALGKAEISKTADLLPILQNTKLAGQDEPSRENILQAGEAALYAAEILESLNGPDGNSQSETMESGFLPDYILRRFGMSLLDGTIPGVAILTGAARNSGTAAQIVKNLRSKGIMVMLAGAVIDQSQEENVPLGADYLTFPLGNPLQMVHAFDFTVRIGLAFGGVAAGDRDKLLQHQKNRVPAFVIALGEWDPQTAALCAGAMLLGFPVTTDQNLPDEMQIPGLLETENGIESAHQIIRLALEMRGIKLKQGDIPVPVSVNPAFEGEHIRKADAWVEFGGRDVQGFELVRMVGRSELEDGKVTVIGPEIDEIPQCSEWPIGIVVFVYGRKMQEDFESVLERQIHYFISYGEGLWHLSGRDLIWLRISNGAKAAGFAIHHLGEILIAKLKAEYQSIVDRVEVKIYTDAQAVDREIALAREVYEKRDARLRGLKDETVDTYYSCTLCQSHSPNHVCIITPERVGVCGAVTWLDAKAAHEINPTGPNQPICKGECLDAAKGMWKNVNDFMYKASNCTVEKVNLYSVMDNPVTSCGCFEAVMAILPPANGVMISARDYLGDTPSGMSFAGLMGACGGGVQIPGFLGISRRYIVSAKFIAADGGLKRIVWMSRNLKEAMRNEITQRALDLDLGENFVDKIADETIGINEEELLAFLQEKQHPALTMEPML